MPSGRVVGSTNRRTAFAGRSLSAIAREYSEEALLCLVAIGRGDIETANAKAYKPKPGRPKKAKAKGKKAKPVEASELEPIPWSARIVAWIHVLDRTAGKPFQSVEIFDEKDVKISFTDGRDLRQKLINQGMPVELLPPPPESEITIDADAVRAEVERDNEDIRRRRGRS